jgi:hypothetical protein
LAPMRGFGTEKVPFTMYLATPKHTGDIASVILSGTLPIAGTTENVVGRLFKTQPQIPCSK